MQLSVQNTAIDAVKVIVPEVFKDDRGFFMEVYREDQFRDLGLPAHFVQFNHSGSVRDTLRGLHFQWNPPMGKLMRVTRARPRSANGSGLKPARKIVYRYGPPPGLRAVFVFCPTMPKSSI